MCITTRMSFHICAIFINMHTMVLINDFNSEQNGWMIIIYFWRITFNTPTFFWRKGSTFKKINFVSNTLRFYSQENVKTLQDKASLLWREFQIQISVAQKQFTISINYDFIYKGASTKCFDYSVFKSYYVKFVIFRLIILWEDRKTWIILRQLNSHWQTNN
jgi:hypothetical protein